LRSLSGGPMRVTAILAATAAERKKRRTLDAARLL